ncbi:hypothetical protein AAZX31_11G133200 [Glycine max]|uniref:Uncharacterized protein n=1 Tax=Glycine soja TaxID=3848 RepID=A0A445I1C1_GLYSO|nr:hypothetical protein JHK87_030819 [Glycine soja]KAG4988566.1 hypothetical protein JHK85_031549 [Glycine max]KAG5145586.1 hypothetical protein JHK84_031129 [Glycine max]KAH1159028.1 hypothetical protein GYH30_030973 [Glycine max]KAH1224807.1 hypothetical protein GmHk_11G031861 [Glycine max]
MGGVQGLEQKLLRKHQLLPLKFLNCKSYVESHNGQNNYLLSRSISDRFLRRYSQSLVVAVTSDRSQSLSSNHLLCGRLPILAPTATPTFAESPPLDLLSPLHSLLWPP